MKSEAQPFPPERQTGCAAGLPSSLQKAAQGSRRGPATAGPGPRAPTAVCGSSEPHARCRGGPAGTPNRASPHRSLPSGRRRWDTQGVAQCGQVSPTDTNPERMSRRAEQSMKATAPACRVKTHGPHRVRPGGRTRPATRGGTRRCCSHTWCRGECRGQPEAGRQGPAPGPLTVRHWASTRTGDAALPAQWSQDGLPETTHLGPCGRATDSLQGRARPPHATPISARTLAHRRDATSSIQTAGRCPSPGKGPPRRPSQHPKPAFLWERALKPEVPTAPGVSRPAASGGWRRCSLGLGELASSGLGGAGVRGTCHSGRLREQRGKHESTRPLCVQRFTDFLSENANKHQSP